MCGLFPPLLTQQDRGDVDVQPLFGSNPHPETWRVEAAGGLLLPGEEAGPGLDEGLPAWSRHTVGGEKRRSRGLTSPQLALLT